MEQKRLKKAAALKYRPQKDNAPHLVAFGRGKLAEEIIKLADEHGVPLHEDRDLVEFLSTLEVGGEIPEEIYLAVAEILAFIYHLGQDSPD